MINIIPGYEGVLINVEDVSELPTAISILQTQLDEIDTGHPVSDILEKCADEIESELY